MRPIDLIPGFAPTRGVRREPDDSFTVTVKPPAFMGLPQVEVRLTRRQYLNYLRWINGDAMIQELLPELSADDREKLLSGIGDEDFRRLARDEDDQ